MVNSKTLSNKELLSKNYRELIDNIGKTLEEGRKKALYAVNTVLVKTYWEIGRCIVEYEIENKEKMGYGSKLFDNLAKDLRKSYGIGFSRSNVIYMRLLYLKYSKSQTLSDQIN